MKVLPLPFLNRVTLYIKMLQLILANWNPAKVELLVCGTISERSMNLT